MIYNEIDYLGNRTGRLVVESFNSKQRKQRYWNVRCDCGTRLVLSSSKLNKRKSCGCLAREQQSERMKGKKLGAKEHGVASRNYTFHVYRIGAEVRNIEFSLDFNYFIDLIVKPCIYCGRSNTRSITHNNRNNPFNGSFECTGIDRLDNSQGYTIENCVPCCWDCNNAKKDMSYDQYREWIKLTYEHMYRS